MATTWSFTVYPNRVTSITINGTETVNKANNVFTTSNYSDGDWIATPTTVGNVTTYTLTKSAPSKKQRLFYTYENGNRVLRFLRSGF